MDKLYCAVDEKKAWKEGCKRYVWKNREAWKYNFEEESNEGTKGHWEQSYLSRTIWCYLLEGKNFSEDCLGKKIDIFIEEHRVRYLFDVMNNPKNKSQQLEQLYHTIGNFTPVPVLKKTSGKRANTIQCVHNWCGEGRWDKVLSCMSQGYYQTKKGNKIPIIMNSDKTDEDCFKIYMKNTYQQLYYKGIFDKEYEEYKRKYNEGKRDEYINDLCKKVEEWNKRIDEDSSLQLLVLDEKAEEYEQKVIFLIEARGRCIVAKLKEILGSKEMNYE